MSIVIFVNDDDPPNRQTFTIAHELGHKLLGHNPNEYGVLFRRQVFGENPPVEKEANWFAANLLVPEEMLRRIQKKYDLTERDTEVLAGIFGVSREMIQYRIKQLRYAQ